MKNTKKSYSLKNRIIFTISFIVIVVSSIIAYISSDMIFDDKRAYLYENALNNISTGMKTIEAFAQSKERQIYSTLNTTDQALRNQFWSQDKDILEIKTLWLTSQAVDEKVEFINEAAKKEFSKKSDKVVLTFDEIKPYLIEAKTAGLVKKIHTSAKKLPHLIIIIHNPSKDEFLMHDFMINNIMEDTFGRLPYEINLTNKAGETFYNNRPHGLNKAKKAFLANFVPKLSGGKNASTSGVRQLNINNQSNIVAYVRSAAFTDYFIVGNILTSQAYDVTFLLIIKTALYTLGLIGVFNLLALFFARSITKPMDKLNSTIKDIMGGQANARVEHQKMSELQLVGTSFNSMIEQIQDHSRSLEKKVEERTRELKEATQFIQAMVDSLGQGLLVFDQNGIALDTYTKACLTLLGKNPAGKDLAGLINYKNKKELKEWITALFEEPLPFEDLVPLGPKNVTMNVPPTDPKFKHVTLDFFPMRGEDQKVVSVVMVATNKTQEFLSLLENEAQQNYTKMLSKILKDRANFTRFISQFDALRDVKVSNAEERLSLMRNLHSMKGMAGFYNMVKVVSYLHEFENYTMSDKADLNLIPKKIGELMKLIETVITEVGQFSDTLLSKTVKIELDELQLRIFHEEMLDRDPKVAQMFKKTFLDLPVETYIEQYKILVPEVAERLGKKVNPLVVNNGTLKVDRSQFLPFFDSCIHLFRNSVDHGVESPEKRMEAQKPEAGTITLNFSETELNGKKFLVFEMIDDGKGIDPNAIRKKMTSLKYPQAEIDQSDEEVIFHIFDPSFSTAEVTSDISGRGIGLYDIKALTEKYGGKIGLTSVPGQGTTFSFTLSMET